MLPTQVLPMKADSQASLAVTATPMGHTTTLAAAVTGGVVQSTILSALGTAGCSTSVPVYSAASMVSETALAFVALGIRFIQTARFVHHRWHLKASGGGGFGGSRNAGGTEFFIPDVPYPVF